MVTLDQSQCGTIAAKIVTDYGDGTLQPGRYIFDQITTIPTGVAGVRMKAAELLSSLHDNEFILIVDPHPNNKPFAAQVAETFGAPGSLGFRVDKDEALAAFSYDNCDMYLTRDDGTLIAVGTHEDPGSHNNRLIWVPRREPIPG
ncbi:MAG TPA: hypothetical protein VHV55_20805 [Pirellulales bacterium]|jgi:hypothetical protein|nr:hypothetical protein [Pirellulales bacterium]